MINEQIYIKLKKVLNHFILNRGSGSSKAAIKGVENVDNALLLSVNPEHYRQYIKDKSIGFGNLDHAINGAVVLDNSFIMDLFSQITKDGMYFEKLYTLNSRLNGTEMYWLDKYLNGFIMFRITSESNGYVNFIAAKLVRRVNELPYFINILTNEVFDFNRRNGVYEIEFMFIPSKTEKFDQSHPDSYKNAFDAI